MGGSCSDRRRYLHCEAGLTLVICANCKMLAAAKPVTCGYAVISATLNAFPVVISENCGFLLLAALGLAAAESRPRVDDERVTGMPIYWTIDSRERLLSVRAEGEVSLVDALALLEAMSGANALSYRKLFDGRTATSSMSGDEILTLCAEIRAYHAKGGPMGALAVVATPEQTGLFARLLGALAAANRRMKVFDSVRQARGWLEGQADPASRKEEDKA